MAISFSIDCATKCGQSHQRLFYWQGRLLTSLWSQTGQTLLYLDYRWRVSASFTASVGSGFVFLVIFWEVIGSPQTFGLVIFLTHMSLLMSPTAGQKLPFTTTPTIRDTVTTTTDDEGEALHSPGTRRCLAALGSQRRNA